MCVCKSEKEIHETHPTLNVFSVKLPLRKEEKRNGLEKMIPTMEAEKKTHSLRFFFNKWKQIYELTFFVSFDRPVRVICETFIRRNKNGQNLPKTSQLLNAYILSKGIFPFS